MVRNLKTPRGYCFGAIAHQRAQYRRKLSKSPRRIGALFISSIERNFCTRLLGFIVQIKNAVSAIRTQHTKNCTLHGFASKVGNHSWIESVQGAIATWSTIGVKIARKYRMLIRDQVATAPCTDPIHVRLPTFESNALCTGNHRQFAHAATSTSSTLSSGNGSPRSRSTSTCRLIASRTFIRASSRVLPWLMQPGRLGTSATIKPSSQGYSKTRRVMRQIVTAFIS